LTPEVVVAERAALASQFAARVAEASRAAVTGRGRFSCALPGGSVAEAFFPVLARAEIDWDHVEFFWGDERAVGPDDPESNYALARRLLLEPVHANSARVHRMRGENPDPAAAARVYAAEMVRVLGDPPRLDVAVLGVGPEGHVCSLFPQHPALSAREWVIAIDDSPKPPPRRLTLTLAALEHADLICVAAFGESKAAAIRQAVEDSASRLPVALAARAAKRALFLVDAAAASGLRKTNPR
jgi:6-phosphogluconolactonase